MFVLLKPHTFSNNRAPTTFVVGGSFLSTLSFGRGFSNANHTFMDSSTNSSEGLLEAIRQYLTQYYQPATNPVEATIHLSTIEIFENLLKIYPNCSVLTADVVAIWLHNAGFKFVDFGNMDFKWIMNKGELG